MLDVVREALACLEPRPRERSLDWSRAHVQTHEGRPYDHAAYPHMGAPGGPFDALDDPTIRRIVLQWATRLGKSFFGQCATLFTADTRPGGIMFGSVDKKLAIEVIGRTYKMIERCDRLRDQLLPEGLRRDDRIDLAHCRIYVGWSRSPGTLADKSCRMGHANELPKWVHQSSSREAHPFRLFAERFKEFPHHKQVVEGSPTVAGQCKIEELLLASDYRRFWVPCPHCGRYQVLKFGDGDAGAGVVWEKTATGRNDVELCRRTARYRCGQCAALIENHHRGPMMRAGVWAPEGCGVDDALARQAAAARARPIGTDGELRPATLDYLTGAPARSGPDAGHQLSSLYALSLTWGDYAAEFLRSRGRPSDLQNWVNGWEGRTFARARTRQTWEELGERIIGRVPAWTVPEGFSLVTAGVDKQEDRYEWTLDAWAPGRSSHTLAYGSADDLDQLFGEVISRDIPHADGGPPVRPAFTLIDSGFRPRGVYQFCLACVQQGWMVLPAKGASKPLGAEYRKSTLGKDTSMPGMIVVLVDSLNTQEWIEGTLHTLRPTDVGGYSLHAGTLEEHQDFLEQLLNDALVSTLDRENRDRESWQRIDATTPNDFRDARRYAFVAMLLATRGRPIPPRVITRAAKAPRPAEPPANTGPRVRTPDGRPFLITER